MSIRSIVCLLLTVALMSETNLIVGLFCSPVVSNGPNESVSSRISNALLKASNHYLGLIAGDSTRPDDDNESGSDGRRTRDKWRSVLEKMTNENPCGSSENYTMCKQCGELTGNKQAFYQCCLNEGDIRPFCIKFINHTID